MSNFIPYIVERSGIGEKTYDIFSKLLKERIIFMDGEINDQSADLVIAQLLYLEQESPKKDISLYINSAGGSVTAGLAIYDTIKYINSPVKTICVGQAASMAAVILAAGEKGGRYLLPSSRVMIHQPFGGVEGQASDVRIQANELIRIKRILVGYLASDCDKTIEQIEKDIQRDYFMSAEEAVLYKIADEILVRKDKKSSSDKEEEKR
ncbi:MAG TPA: ATP-dependent Clp protease proteolytic subunit [Spirochaetaceae bacterium]|nr:ATP-dependent Clp protease proteolytic subunit [Spirochaetaceae bacterium]